MLTNRDWRILRFSRTKSALALEGVLFALVLGLLAVGTVYFESAQRISSGADVSVGELLGRWPSGFQPQSLEFGAYLLAIDSMSAFYFCLAGSLTAGLLLLLAADARRRNRRILEFVENHGNMFVGREREPEAVPAGAGRSDA